MTPPRKRKPHPTDPCRVEWRTKDGVELASHEMPRRDAEAMALVLDGDADVVPSR